MIEERYVTDQCSAEPTPRPFTPGVTANVLRMRAKKIRKAAQMALEEADVYEAAADQIESVQPGPLHELILGTVKNGGFALIVK